MAMPRNDVDVMATFEDRYTPEPNTGCWLWTGSIVGRGYGAVSLGCVMTLAHRLSWKLHFGEIPTGLFICHKCDVPSCVNPAHLFLGTAKENSRDMVSKSRSASGARHGRAKLSHDDVNQIRARRSSGESCGDLAMAFGVSRDLIYKIVKGRLWRS